MTHLVPGMDPDLLFFFLLPSAGVDDIEYKYQKWAKHLCSSSEAAPVTVKTWWRLHLTIRSSLRLLRLYMIHHSGLTTIQMAVSKSCSYLKLLAHSCYIWHSKSDKLLYNFIHNFSRALFKCQPVESFPSSPVTTSKVFVSKISWNLVNGF